MYVTISISLCLVFMLIYNTIIITKYKKVPKSLSETAYLISNGGNIRRYLFTLYCTLTGITLLPPLFIVTPENLEFIPFLLCASFLFSGFSPAYKSGIERPIHYISAYMSFTCFILYGILCMGWPWLVGFVIILGGLCIWKPKCYVYFAEILALIGICLWILV